jgi:hypothetical protein
MSGYHNGQYRVAPLRKRRKREGDHLDTIIMILVVLAALWFVVGVASGQMRLGDGGGGCDGQTGECWTVNEYGTVER